MGRFLASMPVVGGGQPIPWFHLESLAGKDTVHLLDEHEALKFVEFDLSVQPKDRWLAPEPMAAFLDKHFNRSLSEEEREAIMQDFPKPNCDVLVTPRIDKEVKGRMPTIKFRSSF